MVMMLVQVLKNDRRGRPGIDRGQKLRHVSQISPENYLLPAFRTEMLWMLDHPWMPEPCSKSARNSSNALSTYIFSVAFSNLKSWKKFFSDFLKSSLIIEAHIFGRQVRFGDLLLHIGFGGLFLELPEPLPLVCFIWKMQLAGRVSKL